MVLVIGGLHDLVARTIVAAWSEYEARLLTPADLAAVGWRQGLDDPSSGRMALDGQIVEVDRLSGVYTRLPCVTEEDLPQIDATDRAYVAAEMTAFLLWWLSCLPCPVLNRPTPTCLAGPGWRAERWIATALRQGIPSRSMSRHVAIDELLGTDVTSSDQVTLTVVGDRWWGPGNRRLGLSAVHLSRTAGTEILAVSFDGAGPEAKLVGAHVWPDVLLPDVSTAVLGLLTGKS